MDRKEIKVKLVGEDGNVFSIIGRISKVLRRKGLPKEAKEFSSRSLEAGSYHEVLSIAQDYVDIC